VDPQHGSCEMSPIWRPEFKKKIFETPDLNCKYISIKFLTLTVFVPKEPFIPFPIQVPKFTINMKVAHLYLSVLTFNLSYYKSKEDVPT